METSVELIVERIDHVSIIVTDVDRARAFYGGLLGLTEVPRPRSFDFPGAWFQAGAEVIHLLGQPAADVRGRRHFCLSVRDVHAAARYLESKGLPVRWEQKYKIDGIDRFFTDDPDGNRVEFQGAEA
jgi:glyoxylase I family protein